jgi:hypothetical protein
VACGRQAALRTSIYSRASIDRRSWIYSRSGRIFMNGTLSVSQLISRILPLGLLPGCLYCERCLWQPLAMPLLKVMRTPRLCEEVRTSSPAVRTAEQPPLGRMGHMSRAGS